MASGGVAPAGAASTGREPAAYDLAARLAQYVEDLLRYEAGGLSHDRGRGAVGFACGVLMEYITSSCSVLTPELAVELVSLPSTRDALLAIFAAVIRLSSLQWDTASSSAVPVPSSHGGHPLGASAAESGAQLPPQAALAPQPQHLQQPQLATTPASGQPRGSHTTNDMLGNGTTEAKLGDGSRVQTPKEAEDATRRDVGDMSLGFTRILISFFYKTLFLATSAVLDFARRLLRIQALQCCSRCLAAAAAEVREHLGSGSQAGGPQQPQPQQQQPAAEGAGEAAGGSPPWAERARDVLRRSEDAVRTALDLLSALWSLATMVTCTSASKPPASSLPAEHAAACRAYVSELGAALRDSCLLEHAAQALMLSAQLEEQVAGAGAAGPAGAAAAAGTDAPGGGTPPATLLLKYLPGWLGMTHSILVDSNVCGPETQAALRQALSGTCVSHLLATAAVATLTAVDGGPVYGMPPELLRVLPVLGLPPGKSKSAGRVDLRHNPCCRTVCPEALEVLLLLQERGPPCVSSPQHGAPLALLQRVGRAALASAQAWVAEQGRGCRQEAPGSSGVPSPAAPSGERVQASTVAGADSGGPGPYAAASADGGLSSAGGEGQLAQRQQALPLRCILPKEVCANLVIKIIGCLDSMTCTDASRAAGWAPAALLERWRLAVGAASHVAQLAGPVELERLGQSLRFQITKRVPRDGPLSPHPPPALAAALGAGLLPCLERLLRRAAASPSCPEAVLLCRALNASPSDEGLHALLVGLLAYSDPRGAAALLASLAKALRRAVPALLAGPEPPATQPAGQAPGAASSGGVGTATAGSTTSSAAGAVLEACACLLLRSAESLPAAGWALARGNRDAATAAAAPARQLVQLESCALYDMLPQLSYMVQRASQMYDGGSGYTMTPRVASCLYSALLPLMAWLSLLPPSPPPSAPTNDSVAVSTAPPPTSDGEGHLRRLLLEDVGAVPMLGAAVRLLGAQMAIRDLESLDVLWRNCAIAVSAVAAACPQQLRLAAGAAALAAAEGRAEHLASSAPGGEGGGLAAVASVAAGLAAADVMKLSFWPPQLVRRVAAEARRREFDQAADGATAVAQRIEGWMLGAEGDALHAPALQGSNATFAAAGQALVARAEARGLLRGCGNPGCTNLAGDSEAELPLKGCAGCGVMGYCCRECQTAHWRAGHKAACSGTRRK